MDRRNEKQRLCNFFFLGGGGRGEGGHIRCMMGNVEVAYSPRSIY